MEYEHPGRQKKILADQSALVDGVRSEYTSHERSSGHEIGLLHTYKP